MIHTRVKLGTQPLKLTNDVTLFQNEKCVAKAKTGTLTLTIVVEDETVGQLFIGKGELTLDAIVETPRGAVGNSLTRTLTSPFLMFGPVNGLQEKTVPATLEDVKSMGYTDQEDLMAEANDLLHRFMGHHHGHMHFGPDDHLLALSNETGAWDILTVKGNKLVYASRDSVYISKGNGKSVVMQPDSMVVKGNGKTVIITGDSLLVNKDHDHNHCCH